MGFLPAELIKKKRRAESHSRSEIEFLLHGYLDGSIPDYQMSAWLMAVYFTGLQPAETAALTEIMMRSGRTLDFRGLKSRAVDKHSTGGVGDKTSLIIAPLVAAAGIPVPMMAGRGLGHTGGTLDKLESIPGFNVHLDLARFTAQIGDFGTAIIGQSKEICPADLKLYALRDVTGTVDSIPLICASIMSKKLAEGIQGLVLDVKCGNGAFMKDLTAAQNLAKNLIEIGTFYGLKVHALITNMNQPLGRFVGNAVEVQECVDILQGRNKMENGFDSYQETRELSLELSARMLVVAGHSKDVSSARIQLEKILASGAAWEKFLGLCERQDAKANWRLPVAKQQKVIVAEQGGFVEAIDSEQVGLAGIELGAGRRRTTDPIDHAAGIEVMIKIGQKVTAKQPLFRLLSNQMDAMIQAEERLKTAVQIVERSVPPPSLILAELAGA